MVETLGRLEAGTVTPEAQDDSHATLAPILRREDARIDFTRSAREIDRLFRAFQPWPGTFTTLRGKKLIVHAMHVGNEVKEGVPGALLVVQDAMHVVCGESSRIVLDEVQMEGKTRMRAAEFLRGFQVKSGEVLGGAHA